jgi:hypothetical protein
VTSGAREIKVSLVEVAADVGEVEPSAKCSRAWLKRVRVGDARQVPAGLW